MNNAIEMLFEDFLNAPMDGELAEAMHRISAEIDAQIKAGAVDEDTIGDYELAAMKNGFYAGFAAAMGLQQARIQIALARHRGQMQGEA